jgi:peptide/nickel transport system permease protein
MSFSGSKSGLQAPAIETAIRVIGLAGLGLIAVVVALADVIARTPAGIAVLSGAHAPDAIFLFGADAFGRDVMSESLHALSVTFANAAIAAVIAIIAGAVAGFAAVRTPLNAGVALRWLSGVLAAIPMLLLAIVVFAAAGDRFAAIAAGLAAAPAAFNRSFDRAMQRAHSRHAEFARATGIPASTLLRRDLVYEVRGNFLNVAGRALASTAIVISTMSFLGFGAGAPHRDLGLMIAEARMQYFDLWWTAFFPALLLVLLILSARLAAALGEGEPP